MAPEPWSLLEELSAESEEGSLGVDRSARSGSKFTAVASTGQNIST
jgi:hypothetical protein